MTALKHNQVDGFVAQPNPAQPVLLVYGSDAGLVRERAEALIRSAVDDLDDPFSLVRLDGELLESDPARLVEEANTMPLFGGRRAVWVKAVGHKIAPAVEMLLKAAPRECRVVIEAGALRKNAPLRAACERARNSAVLACYPDDEKSLPRLIDAEMRAAGLTIAPEARAALVSLIGGDRLASRSELQKLALYAHDKGRVEIQDVAAVVTDASAETLDQLVDAAFGGKLAEVEVQFAKAVTAGTSMGSVLFVVARHAGALHKARLGVDEGQPIEAATGGMWLNFGRRSQAEAALRSWSAARLQHAIIQIGDATLQARRNVDLDEAIVQRLLLSLAMAARRRD
ncbi:MAG: DNA polymerase III subunit delta [Hyphomicrobiales bacterium]|nr:DNA polymerase III subunit delta [Hyphomicrobiales bacterium]